MRRRYRIILELELMEDKEPEALDWQELLQLEENEYVDVIDVEEEDDVW
tara:strand:- start:1285 stop:1431 length:147 start_codon:yes stop_codon:yes gene_type:complete